MLAGLDQVDWGYVRHAYGRATDVPGQLRALRSDDPAERDRARRQLWGNVFHQGTRYEATASAVPFLIELVADPGTAERAALLELLGSITVGFDEFWLPNPIPIAEHRRQADGGAAVVTRTHEPRPPSDEDEDEDDADFDDEFDEDDGDGDDGDGDDEDDDWMAGLSEEETGRYYAYAAVTAYDAVRAGLPVYRQLLADPELAAWAAYLIGWFPEDAPASLAALSTVVDGPADSAGESAVATARVAAGLLGGEVPAGGLDDGRPLVRWATAIARAHVRGPAAEQFTVDELLAWAGGTSAGEAVPYLDGDAAGYAALALRQADPRRLDDFLAALVRRLPHTSGKPALAVTIEALRWVFPDGRADLGALDDRQRLVVRALAEAEEPWLVGGIQFGNFSQLVREFGLPATRDELRGMVL